MAIGRKIGGTLLAGLVVFAACYGLSRLGVFEWPRRYDPFALPDLADPPGILTAWQMKLVDADAGNCALALSRVGIPAQLKPTEANSWERFLHGGRCHRFGAAFCRHAVARGNPLQRCRAALQLGTACTATGSASIVW
jgi:hypothetical protein